MRLHPWSRFCCWLLQLSLGLGMVLASLSAASWASAAVHTAPAPQQLAAEPHSAAPHGECHGHASAQTESPHADSAHWTAHADCHHCCPLGWGSGLGMAGHAAPNIHPAGPMTDWPSAIWGPDLRPPIA